LRRDRQDAKTPRDWSGDRAELDAYGPLVHILTDPGGENAVDFDRGMMTARASLSTSSSGSLLGALTLRLGDLSTQDPSRP
jgi:hypothetical protein